MNPRTTDRRVVIQVPAYAEPRLAETLDAIAGQPTPGWATVQYEAWVTPSADDPLACGTYRQARDHAVFEAREAPAGKLQARNAAHESAVQRGADVVVTWDADAPPLAADTLQTLLAPLSEGAVGVNSRPRSPWTVVGTATNLLATLEDVALPHFNGQLHGFTAGAWDAAGPFNTDRDPTSVYEVRAEEEFWFRRRVARQGPVVNTSARVLNDTRRTECRLGLRNDGFCRRADEGTTFAPRNRRG